MRYTDYLKTDHWKHIRSRALRHYGYRCMTCGRTEDLNVHHRSYDVLGRERMKHLLVLCKRCHHRLHKQFKIGSRRYAAMNRYVKLGLGEFSAEHGLVVDQQKRDRHQERARGDRKRKADAEKQRVKDLAQHRSGKVYNPILGTWSSKTA